jgi:hypothetical protein
LSLESKKAYDYVVETFDRVLVGEIEPEDLIVSKVLRRPVSECKSVFPRVAAVIQLVQKGKKVKSGTMLSMTATAAIFIYGVSRTRNLFGAESFVAQIASGSNPINIKSLGTYTQMG